MVWNVDAPASNKLSTSCSNRRATKSTIIGLGLGLSLAVSGLLIARQTKPYVQVVFGQTTAGSRPIFRSTSDFDGCSELHSSTYDGSKEPLSLHGHFGDRQGHREEGRDRNAVIDSGGRDVVCVIDRYNSVKMAHAAHAAQALFPCWSLFVKAGAGAPVDVANVSAPPPRRFVVFIQEGPRECRWGWVCKIKAHFDLLKVDLRVKGYGAALVAAMGATVVVNDSSSLCGRGSGIDTYSDVLAQWFDGDKDAGLLRRKLLAEPIHHKKDAESTRNDGCSDVLRVGILNRTRRDGRSLLNAEEIATALVDAPAPTECPLQRIEVEQYVFDGLPLKEQAGWMAKQDVVISPHGNQLTNIAFGLPCTVLLELFPPNYFVPQFFQTLAKDAGVLPFYMYANDPEPAERYLGRVSARSAQLSYTAGDIMENWNTMLEARRQCKLEHM